MRAPSLRFSSGKRKMSCSVIKLETVANKSPNTALRILISKKSSLRLSNEICNKAFSCPHLNKFLHTPLASNI